MIASDRQALRVGSARLVVDGTDTTLNRKAELSLSPGRVAARRLERLVALSRETYNASVQHRRDAWRWAGVSITAFDQFNELPGVRQVRPDVVPFGNQVLRGAIRRADEAFAGFFRRVRDGEKPGYPRFKSARRFRTVFYDEPECWALRRLGSDHPALHLQGIGEIPLSARGARQVARLVDRGGQARTLTLTKTRSGAWRACVGFRHVATIPKALCDQVGGVDRGVAVTAALPDGTLLVMPGFLAQAREEIAALSVQREAHPRGSAGWRKANKALARTYRKARNRSENWARHTAAEIVSRYGVIAIEDLNLAGMTRSARGTKQNPGRNVAAKAALNRSLQDAALGRLAYWICVKAEEAARRVWKVDPRNSSRTCVPCGHVDPANRRSRDRFVCTRCGHAEHADVNAAQVLTDRGRTAEAAWQAKGTPLLARPKPRLRRWRSDQEPEQYGAGSAPDAEQAA